MRSYIYILLLITLISCQPDTALTWQDDNITYTIHDSTTMEMRFEDGSVNTDTITMTDSSGLKVIRYLDPLMYNGEYFIITTDGTLLSINKENKVFQNIPK